MFRILSGLRQNCGNHSILIKLRALGVGFELEGTGIANDFWIESTNLRKTKIPPINFLKEMSSWNAAMFCHPTK